MDKYENLILADDIFDHSEMAEDSLNPIIEADFPRKGSVKKLMNWVLNGDVNDSSIKLNTNDF